MCSRGHGGGCSHQVADLVQGEEGFRYTMNNYIDFDKVTVLNEAVDGSGVKVFKTWDDRLNRGDYVESDVDEELLFNVPFTGHVKVMGIVIAGDMDDSHPSSLKIFKDRPSMSFEDTLVPPEQEFSIKQDSEGRIDYALKASKFSNLTHLSLYFPTNFGGEKTRIYYVGLRGEYQSDVRQQVTIATYEARPMLKDHETKTMDDVRRDVF